MSRGCRHLLAVLAVGALVASPFPLAAEDGDAGPVPEKNSSYVSSDAEWLRRVLVQSETAARKEDWRAVVRTLQQAVEHREDAERPGAAAPDVVAVRGSAVYEGAWIAAHHRILGYGPPALAAYEAEFGAAARRELRGALTRRDPEGLAEVAD
ncbi:MAG: hypothetical protein ACYTG6_13380, partial [Planctomycetota bacterium]